MRGRCWLARALGAVVAGEDGLGYGKLIHD